MLRRCAVQAARPWLGAMLPRAAARRLATMASGALAARSPRLRARAPALSGVARAFERGADGLKGLSDPPRLDAERFEAELRDAADATAAAELRERALRAVAELGDCDASRELTEAVVVSLVRERRGEAAWEAFDAARSQGVRPSSASFAAVIQASALTDEVERAELAVDAMAACGRWPPPAPCWDNLLFAYAARAEAFTRLTREEKEALRRHGVPAAPSSVVPGALSVLRRMSAEGLSASQSTHLGLLRVLAAAGQPQRAQAVLAALLHARAPVGEAHFACAIDACGVAARLAPGGSGSEELLAEALGVLDALQPALGAPPGARALRAVLRAYASAGRLNRALDWLASGYAAHGGAPSAECYGVAVRMCRETARPDVALEVLRRARAAGLALGEADGAADELVALAVRWQLGSAVRGSAGGGTRAWAAARILFELADEMRLHPPLTDAARDVARRAELGASDQPRPRVLAIRSSAAAGAGSAGGPGARGRGKLRLASRKPARGSAAPESSYGRRRPERT